MIACKPVLYQLQHDMSNKERFIYLLAIYTDGKISDAELDEFYNLLLTKEYDLILDENLDRAALLLSIEKNAGTRNSALILERLMNQIHSTADHRPEEVSYRLQPKKQTTYFTKLAVAASLIFVALFSYYFLTYKSRYNRFSKNFISNSTQRLANTSGKSLSVVLPDGSTVALEPKSALYYSANKFSQSREVYLEGQGYFKVAKNPGVPFYVYYKEIVTKVLGTSFTIKSNKFSGEPEISVLTGKVKVYENADVVNVPQENASVIVVPNQKAVYQAGKKIFKAQLVDDPKPILVNDDEQGPDQTAKTFDFNFKNVKLTDVFNTIEQAYGIQISLNNETLGKSIFSGDVTKDNLFNKLSIICTSTNSTYEIDGTRVLIKSNNNN